MRFVRWPIPVRRPAAPPRAPGRSAALGPALLDWFRTHRRALPWRAGRDPYRIWVAEALLQQTRVAQATRYFERFVARFPNVRALARAPLADVLKAWQGAGYYARARHLHAAAQQLAVEAGGRLPHDVASLERLPGIGPYMARAIASLAFDAPVLAVEANGLRVAARWTREAGDPRTPRVRARLERALEAARPPGPAGTFNEALMELGETVCLPIVPGCDACPVSFGCRAFRETDAPARYPRRRRAARRPHVRAAVVVLRDRGRWLVQRRPEAGLLGGLWEFPGGKIAPGEAPGAAARRELREETGLAVRELRRAGVVRHAYSHFTVELHVFEGRRAGGRGRRMGEDRRWVSPSELFALPIPKATEKIARRLAPGTASRG